MAKRGKTLQFTPEEIEELADMEYGDKRLFATLSFLFPFVNLQNHFHIDHVFPRSRFTAKRLASAGVPAGNIPAFQQSVDRLANLQLLEGPINVEKQASLPAEWLTTAFPATAKRQGYVESHQLGAVPDALTDFETFYDGRRELLKSKLQSLLAS
jgi:hypothetical protein